MSNYNQERGRVSRLAMKTIKEIIHNKYETECSEVGKKNLKLLQAANQSCASCSLFVRKKFITICKKTNRSVNPFNICSSHSSIPTSKVLE